MRREEGKRKNSCTCHTPRRQQPHAIKAAGACENSLIATRILVMKGGTPARANIGRKLQSLKIGTSPLCAPSRPDTPRARLFCQNTYGSLDSSSRNIGVPCRHQWSTSYLHLSPFAELVRSSYDEVKMSAVATSLSTNH